MGKGLFCKIGVALGFLLLCPSAGWTIEDDQGQGEERRADRVEEAIQSSTPRTTEELIEELKQRALKKREEAKRQALWATKGTIGMHFGYDNNVNTDSTRDGAEYLEQYFSYNWTPTFNDYFKAEVGPWYYADIYQDIRDTTIFDLAFKGAVKYYPLGNDSVELQPGMERQWLSYPECDTSSYIEDKAFFSAKHKFWKTWSQDGKYEYSFKEYDKKQPRALDDISVSYIPALVLEKSKHSLEYSISMPWDKNNLKIKQNFYKEVSNDHYQDYYDVYSYKVTGELGRSLTKKLYSKGSVAYERKNYSHRQVASPASYAVAEYDDIYTQKVYLYYTLKKDWTLSYTYTHKRSDSNYAVYDYDQVSHLCGVYVSF